MIRSLSLLLCLCLMLGLLSGCNIGGNAPFVPSGDGLTWDNDPSGPAATTPNDGKVQELTLTYYPGRSMNPYLSGDFTNQALHSLLYQSLFIVDRNYQVEPMLCKRYSVSKDMRTYRFYLEDATFSDGTVLTAADVVATLNTAKNSNIYKGRFRFVSSISQTSDGGVEVRLSTAYENFPLLLDIPILKASEVSVDRPLGTGPYFFEAAAGGMRLRRNSDWWCNGTPLATAPYISLVEAKSPPQIRDQFQFFDLNLVNADPGSDRYAEFRCDYELWDSENGIFLYLAACDKSAVFSNKAVRAALTHAINRDYLAEEFYRGFARSATLPASPLSPFYNATQAAKYGYDPESFRTAVSENNMTGKTVVLLVNKDDSLRLRAARAVGEMLTAGGLVVQMKELDTSAYKKALQNKEYDLYLGQTKLSANMDLSPFFSSSGALNYGGINNITAYALCLEALANSGNYYTLHQNVMDNGLLCPVLFRSYAIYTTRGLLSGLTPSRDNVFYYSLGKSMEAALIK